MNMSLSGFLALVLQAYAHTLQRLAAVLGDKELCSILNETENMHTTARPKTLNILCNVNQSTTELDEHPFNHIEKAVTAVNLSEQLVFHVWSYPYYRAFVESSVMLDTSIQVPGTENGTELVEEAVNTAMGWINAMAIPPSLKNAANEAAKEPWLQFRTKTLKMLGKRPIQAIKRIS